ncbi:hypothetical protein TNCV_4597891 [Trichonephila clavipes]|nr:hypothetical protein TNCV_4597891 [Trichonephila clavipes]
MAAQNPQFPPNTFDGRNRSPPARKALWEESGILKVIAVLIWLQMSLFENGFRGEGCLDLCEREYCTRGRVYSEALEDDFLQHVDC